MIDYQKYSGAGNTFLIVNNLNNQILNHSETVLELIKIPGNEFFDGVIFIEESSIADFHMNYYNKDGTGNALCGNGLRCTMKYLIDNNISKKQILTLEAVSKIYDCNLISEDEICVGFSPPKTIRLNFNLKVHFSEWWQSLNVSYVDIGSPHIIVFIDEIKEPIIKSINEIPVYVWGKYLRMHKDLMPEGANINFIEILSKEKSELAIRSFERGVEAETLACGTGALSSAIVSYKNRDIKTPIKLLTKSGEYLTVNFNIINNQIRNLSLSGKAIQI